MNELGLATVNANCIKVRGQQRGAGGWGRLHGWGWGRLRSFIRNELLLIYSLYQTLGFVQYIRSKESRFHS